MFEHRSDGWYIVQPAVMRADQALVDGITTELAFVHVDRTFPAASNSLESYGLNQPAVTLEFTLSNGAKHKLQLGGKDFAGSSVYALIDDSRDVSLLANTILTVSDKSVEDFRDHSVQVIATGDATSFDLTNESGEVSAVKNGDNWNVEKPRAQSPPMPVPLLRCCKPSEGRESPTLSVRKPPIWPSTTDLREAAGYIPREARGRQIVRASNRQKRRRRI